MPDMKRSARIIFFIVISSLFCGEAETMSMIKKYAGINAPALSKLYAQKEDQEYIRFILDNSSPNDLAVLTPEYILKDIEYALKAKELKYSTLYDETIFKHFVLPLRMTQEPFEGWREGFYKEIHPIVKDIADIEEAAILVNIWAEEKMTYKPTHGKDQAPLTTIKRGYGRCEEMMIIYMAAARSVGIPVRSAGTPLWNFTDSNHAWVEVWTPEGWKYLGEPADRLNSTWFTKTTERASLITSKAFGYYKGDDMIEQGFGSTEISSIKYYTKKWDYCVINIDDGNGMPVEGAKVVFYAVSWGGIFPMSEMESDRSGQVKIPLGRGSAFISAYAKDKGFGYSMFNTLNGAKDIRIELNKNATLTEADLSFTFQIASETQSAAGETKKYFEDKFELMKNNAVLKRNDRLNSAKRTAEFSAYYLKGRNYEESDKFFGEQKEFLKKCDLLGGNTVQFIKAFAGIDKAPKKERKEKFKILSDIIQNWDEKELCEIPDSAAIKYLVDNLYEGRQKFKKNIPDTVFIKNVVSPTWTGGQVVQNGWQKDFYPLVKDLRSSGIVSTVKDVIRWADSKVSVDSAFTYHYYSCPLNPLEIINMKYVPDFYRIKLIDSALKILGVPTRWKGQLEFYNGKDFVVLEQKEEGKEKKIKENELKLSLYADGKKIKAEAWGNFLMGELSEGVINYYYFDGENDSSEFVIKYPEDRTKNLFVQAGIRNTNGDANVVIKPLSQNEISVRIDLKTPKEYLDVSSDIKDEYLQTVSKYISGLGIAGYKILMIRGIVPNEPTHRMTDLLTAKAEEYKKASATLVVYTEIRDDGDISERSGLIKRKGDILIPDVDDKDYPVIMLFDGENKVVFASKGYNMNIADLLLKKLKKN
jgi:hypothetical protein